MLIFFKVNIYDRRKILSPFSESNLSFFCRFKTAHFEKIFDPDAKTFQKRTIPFLWKH
ncbi:hypothetical protein LEP1GSC178_0941 [Leptospira licerasiae str. MMD4847]|uniref:Uncharacterized protein n=1 Tax=Leptospira licerasiae str. MMD4847 TaxID=1049971 RepID=A0ABP2RAA0_9LEPT|nr:hypothetical protein LEP1GSC178_0941 [Leptospira licerasiae str. MMD4847]